jgi:hypothetical protein
VIVQTTWKPKLRNIVMTERPEWVPEWVYTEAITAKRFYNGMWEFWVWEEAKRNNVSQAVAEDACIRGLKTAIDRVKYVYGAKIGKWYEEFLDMKDIFTKVKHPEYKVAKLESEVK